MLKNDVLACISIFGCADFLSRPLVPRTPIARKLKRKSQLFSADLSASDFMISTPDWQALLALCDKFIHSHEHVT
jgi:hypothetical protein